MSVAKKIVAMILALMMILMTMSVLTMQAAYAAMSKDISINGISGPTTYKKDSKINLAFTVMHDKIGKDLIKEDDSNVKVTLEDCDFSDKGTLDMYVYAHIQAGQVLKSEYRIKIDNLTAKGTGSTLKIRVANDKSTPKYNEVIELNVSGYDDGTGGEPTPTPPPTPTASNAKYSIARVMSSKRVGDYDTPNTERKYFDKDNITSSSDASIRQTYFVDITLRVFDDKAPSGLKASDIKGLGASSLDLGSFTYRKVNENNDIILISTADGYYEIILKGIRYSGNGNKLNLRVQTDSYIGDITAEITECITKQEAGKENTNNKDDDDESKLEVETPYVIVSKYGYGGGSVIAGETFPLNLTIYNTSETEVISNMMITMTMPDGLMLTSSSNTFYVPELDKQASINKTVQVTAKSDAKVQSHNVGVAMKYQYVDDHVNSRRSAETTENIAIPVVQIDRFQVTAVEIPMEIMLGEETGVTVNFVNKGRSEAYNLSAEISGNIQNPGQNQNLGNLVSGATGSADFYIMANEVGMCTGEIKITYEDTNMEPKEATIRYNTTVKTPEEMAGNMGMAMGMMGGDMMPGEGEVVPEEKKPLTVPIIVGICIVAAIPVLVIIKKKLDKKRKEREDADL